MAFKIAIATGLLLSGIILARELNPGNIINGPFAQAQGALPAVRNQRFAVFPNRNMGILAMQALLFASPGYRNLTLQQAIHRYAPPVENNTSRYYSHVLRAVGSNKIMDEYTLDEQIIIITAMMIEEGG